MKCSTKDSAYDYKETKVSDFFVPKFSYYSELIDRPRRSSAEKAKLAIFTALVTKSRSKTPDLEEQKQTQYIR